MGLTIIFLIRGCVSVSFCDLFGSADTRIYNDCPAGLPDSDHVGGLLSAIGIAGMDRVTRFNVIAMSGKAVEACGDVDTMILDKTGTITFGNRLAAEFYPVAGKSREDLIDYAALASLCDPTPEENQRQEPG